MKQLFPPDSLCSTSNSYFEGLLAMQGRMNLEWGRTNIIQRKDQWSLSNPFRGKKNWTDSITIDPTSWKKRPLWVSCPGRLSIFEPTWVVRLVASLSSKAGFHNFTPAYSCSFFGSARTVSSINSSKICLRSTMNCRKSRSPFASKKYVHTVPPITDVWGSCCFEFWVCVTGGNG